MCGIAGFIPSREVSEEQMIRTTRRMRHRGPDATGMARLGEAVLLFQRLAILDLSADGNQPMANETNDVWTVFNGEIYNFQALRTELQAKHSFHSRTDTEVLLHGYEEWGFEGLLQRIDGMFAFAIWDQRYGELFLARDRVGKKPLYYAEQRQGLAFASTLNALLELLPRKPVINMTALDEFLVYQAVPAPHTIYTGVSMLPPAHWLHWTPDTPPVVQRYWKLSYANKQRRNEKDLLEEMDHLVRNAVERRLIADVPLGAFLSGGVDSSLIVGVMTSLGAGPVQCVNIGFDDPEFDERPHARKVASATGANLFERVMQADEALNLPQIVWHYGQPMADVSIVPTFAVSRAAREFVTVVLNGDGGDEAFGGYARPVITKYAQLVRNAVPVRLRPAVANLLRQSGKKGHMLAEAITRDPQAAFTYDRGMRLLRESLYTPEFFRCVAETHPDRHYAGVWNEADGPTDTDRALYGDLTTYLPDQLLVKMDVSTMAHSVEARAPLLDTQLLEFAASIPASQLIPGFDTKILLKRLAERYVPKEVVYRRKRGFVMPAGNWLRGPLLPHMRALLTSNQFRSRGIFNPARVEKMIEEHLCGHRNWSEQLWTLVVLEVWYRLFVDGTLTHKSTLNEVL